MRSRLAVVAPVVLLMVIAPVSPAGGSTVATALACEASRPDFNGDGTGVPGAAEPGDQFGTAVAISDQNSDNCADLVVSAPYEDLGSARDAGAVWVIRLRSLIPCAPVARCPARPRAAPRGAPARFYR